MEMPITLSALMLRRQLALKEYRENYQGYNGTNPKILAEIPELERFINNAVFEPSFLETMYKDCSLTEITANYSLSTFVVALNYYLVCFISKRLDEEKYKKIYNDIVQILRFIKVQCTWNNMWSYKKDYLWLPEAYDMSKANGQPKEWVFVKGERVEGYDIVDAIFEKVHHFMYFFSKDTNSSVTDLLEILSTDDYLDFSGEIRVKPKDFENFIETIRFCDRCIDVKVKGRKNSRVVRISYYTSAGKVVLLKLRFINKDGFFCMVGFIHTEAPENEKAYQIGISLDEKYNQDRFFKKCKEVYTKDITRIDLFYK